MITRGVRIVAQKIGMEKKSTRPKSSSKDTEIYFIYDCDSLEIPGTGISFGSAQDSENLVTSSLIILDGDKVIL